MGKPTEAGTNDARDPFAIATRVEGDALAIDDKYVHIYGEKKDKVCSTNSRGHKRPEGRSPSEIVLDASEGFIPLWAENVILKWRFNEVSMQIFLNPGAAKDALRQLWEEAVMAWGTAAPVRFKETDDAWDFEIAMQPADSCTINGCTLARAFFPDSGRHDLALYPKMFTQIRKEQIDTFIHEIGHVFGLRHFFADVSETAWPSVTFGKHKPFSIMNYGAKSELTKDDKNDLERLYETVWSGNLRAINETPVVQVRPFHELGLPR